MQSTFGFWASLVILVNVMDGPGFLAIPKVYREAGWLVPTLGFLVMAAVSCLSGFCVVDVYTQYQQTALSDDAEDEDEVCDDAQETAALCPKSPKESTKLYPSPRGADFPEGEHEDLDDLASSQAPHPDTEFCTLFERYFSPRVRRVAEAMFYLCLFSLILAQIVIGAQVMDGFVGFLFGKTCALEFSPFRWTCTSTIALQPFGAGKTIISAGYLICMGACLWLSSLDMSSNMIPQFVSAGLLVFAATTFFWHFASRTYDPLVPGRLPAIGHDMSGVLGVVIFNYAFVTAVPCVLNSADSSVQMKQVVALAVGGMCFLYILMGILGSMAFDRPDADVMASLLKPNAPVITKLAVFGFSHAIVPCIPVYCLLLQSGFKQNLRMSAPMAYLCGSLVPWMVALFFYNGDGFFDALVRWASLLINGFVNLVFPLALYLQSSAPTASDVNPRAKSRDFAVFREPGASRERCGTVMMLLLVSGVILVNIGIALAYLLVFHKDVTSDSVGQPST